jgi:hypothetical protein
MVRREIRPCFKHGRPTGFARSLCSQAQDDRGILYRENQFANFFGSPFWVSGPKMDAGAIAWIKRSSIPTIAKKLRNSAQTKKLQLSFLVKVLGVSDPFSKGSDKNIGGLLWNI